jgi:hypothetical protein
MSQVTVVTTVSGSVKPGNQDSTQEWPFLADVLTRFPGAEHNSSASCLKHTTTFSSNWFKRLAVAYAVFYFNELRWLDSVLCSTLLFNPLFLVAFFILVLVVYYVAHATICLCGSWETVHVVSCINSSASVKFCVCKFSIYNFFICNFHDGIWALNEKHMCTESTWGERKNSWWERKDNTESICAYTVRT